jgi:LPPG:FO 2-phospho-L-lactate transferase
VKVVALAGGTGSAKLFRGLSRLPVDLTVVANVGDNIWTYGVYVCPDVDIATYTLAGISSPRGWGIAGDTFEALRGLSRLGEETWFRLGDRDLAVCLERTDMLRRGKSLTEATCRIAKSLGVESLILPVTDDSLQTRVITPAGELHLQEFWVRERGKPRATGVKYVGARGAKPTHAVVAALSEADRVVVCPANPVTSIGPMLAVTGFRRLLRESNARIVALSPMEGVAPFSGPAGKLLSAEGSLPDSYGVAGLYSDFADCMVISEADAALGEKIRALGMECVTTDTRMKGPTDELRLAQVMIGA